MKEIMLLLLLYWKMLNVKHSIHHGVAIAGEFRSSINRLENDIQIMIDELQHGERPVTRGENCSKSAATIDAAAIITTTATSTITTTTTITINDACCQQFVTITLFVRFMTII